MQRLRNQPLLVTGLLVTIGWLALHLWSLTHYPPPSCDEAYYSNAAYTLLTTGRFGVTIYDNVAGADTTFVVYGRLVMLTQALFQLLIPSPLWAARLWALAGGLLLVGATYSVGRQLFDRQTAVWAALLTGANWAVFYGSHSARPDGWLAAGAMLALLLVLRLTQKPSPGMALLTGFVVTLLQDVHLNGMHFIAAAGVVAVIILAVEQRRWKLVALYVVGSVLGVGYFLVVHLFPDPKLAVTQYQTLILGDDREFWMHSLWFHLRNLGQFLWANYIRGFSGLAVILSALYITGAAVVPRRDTTGRAARLLAIFVVVSLVSFNLVNVYKPDYYAVLWHAPLTLLGVIGVKTLLAGERLSTLWERLPQWMHTRRVDIVLGSLLLALVAGNVYLSVKFRPADYDVYAQALREAVPPGERVLANELWWYALYDRDMIASIRLYTTYYIRHEPVGTPYYFEQDMAQTAPSYIVLGELVGCRALVDETYWRLAAYAQSTCKPIRSISGTWFEDSVVYYCEDQP